MEIATSTFVPALTNQEMNATMQCYGEYTAGHPDCDGGVDLRGGRKEACRCKVPCRNVAATLNAQQTIRPETLYAARSPGASTSTNTFPQIQRAPVTPPSATPAPLYRNPAPAPAMVPVQAQAPVAAQQPQYVQHHPQPPPQHATYAGGVVYQPVATAVPSRLPVEEPKSRSKTERFAANVARAGLVAALLQAGSSLANTPFFDDE